MSRRCERLLRPPRTQLTLRSPDNNSLTPPVTLPSSAEERSQTARRMFASLDEEVPSISLGRSHHVDNKHVSTVLDPSSATAVGGPVPPPRLAGVRNIRLPHRDDPRAALSHL